MIKLLYAQIEGFGSIVEPTKFKINRPGFNIIIAPNGSGKTTAMSAISWAAYGKSLKGIKDVSTWDRYQTKTYKGTKVELHFRKGKDRYTIIRTQDYRGRIDNVKAKNVLIILCNGEDISKRNKGDRQGQINEIMGYSFDLFVNSVIFGQRMKRIIQETGPNKKKVFEEAFDAFFLNNARKKAEEDYKTQKESYQKELHEFEIKKESLKRFKIQYLSEKEALKKFKSNKKEKIDDLKTQIKELRDENLGSEIIEFNIKNWTEKAKPLKEEIDTWERTDSDKALEDASREEFKAKNALDMAEYEVSKAESRIDALKLAFKSLKKSCPRCGNKLSVKQIKEQTSKHKEELKALRYEVLTLEKEVKEKEKDYNYKVKVYMAFKQGKELYKESQSKYSLYVSKIDKAKNLLEESKKVGAKIGKLRERIKEQKAQNFNVKKLDQYKSEYTNLKKYLKEQKASLKKESKTLENLKWVTNEALSNKGLKAYIFDTMLDNLNHQLRYYEQFIGYRVEFKVDLESANKDLYTVVYEKDDLILYDELSGGQQQLVDIATAFSIHDLISSQKQCNLLVMDEVFEGLDEGNVDIVHDLIKDKAQDKCLFLITHNLAMQNAGDKVIRMSRVGGRTVLKLLS